MKLNKAFYLRENVVQIAKDLLGKCLCTNFDGVITSGIITETEAYEGITDKASHAYGNRLTQRTEIMYREGGIAYVYLCYGMYSLFNVVTNNRGIPHAVLIRGIHPLEGL
jgi:DNA-3-methyladenine glycosylase